MFTNFYFCWDTDFSLFSGFSVFFGFFSLKRYYISILENAIVYYCMWSTTVNMFFTNLGFDKSGTFWRGAPPTQKVEEYLCYHYHIWMKVLKKIDGYTNTYLSTLQLWCFFYFLWVFSFLLLIIYQILFCIK